MLICEPIEVQLKQAPAGVKEPEAFTWRGTRYVIEEILSAWVDAGKPSRKWYQRRHRNYFRVRCDDSRVYELYLERPSFRCTWILSKRLSA